MNNDTPYHIGLEMKGTITLGVSIAGRIAVIDIPASALCGEGVDIERKSFDEFYDKQDADFLEMALFQPTAHQLTATLQGEIVKKLKETCEARKLTPLG